MEKYLQKNIYIYIYIYITPNHFVVQQKLIQQCNQQYFDKIKFLSLNIELKVRKVNQVRENILKE